jgi:transposase InsO family protein
MSSYPDRGFRAVLVLIDGFTKKLYAEPLRGESEQEVTSAMKKILDASRQKKWSAMQSDFGAHFRKVFGAMLKARGITHFYSQIARPQSNSFAERTVGVVKRMLFTLMTSQGDKKWVANLPIAVANINASRSFTTGMTPDALEKAGVETQQQVAQRIMGKLNRRYKVPQASTLLAVGQHVRVRRDLGRLKKPGAKGFWSDHVYTVCRVVQSKDPHILPTYMLKDGRGHVVGGRRPRSELLAIPPPAEDGQEEEEDEPPHTGQQDEEPEVQTTPRKSTRMQGEYEVDYIAKVRYKGKGRRRHKEYLVHWVGYKTPTWEPESNLENAQEALRDFDELEPR